MNPPTAALESDVGETIQISREGSDADVVILGGAFSGSATATLLLRERPGLRVVIVEKAEAFDAKVGEATTEMSAMFLTRRLALWEHLEREHLPKEGLRYWFGNERVTGHANASETGGVVRSTVPSFQLRRDVLDEHVASLGMKEGAEILRPARATEVRIGDFEHEVDVLIGRETSTIRTRWVIDATGRSSHLGRALGLIEPNERHPISAVWGRWKDVRHIDDIAARNGKLGEGNVASRRLSTNHYPGYGFWIWVIPLGNGETSIGIVWDQRKYDFRSRGTNTEAAYRAALAEHPQLRELLDGAELRTDDLRSLQNLAYRTRQYMGAGWALVGDAAIFLDPYYSPGLDHASFSVEATVAIVLEDLAGSDVSRKITQHNEVFLRSHDRFFEAVYLEKYAYMGEHDLLSAAMLLDTAQYYIFVVIPAYRFHRRFHWMPVLGPRPAFISYHMMRLYNRRFAALADLRRAAGEAGARNDGRRIAAYFNLHFAPLRMAVRGVGIWMRAEIDGVRLRLKMIFRPSETKTARDDAPEATMKGGSAAPR